MLEQSVYGQQMQRLIFEMKVNIWETQRSGYRERSKESRVGKGVHQPKDRCEITPDKKTEIEPFQTNR